MSFEGPERKPEPETNKEALLEKLKESLKMVALDLRDNGIAVHDDARVDMKAFAHAGVYSESNVAMNQFVIERLNIVFRDQQDRQSIGQNPNMTATWRTAKEVKNREAEKIKRSGEQLECLKTIVFHKFLKEYFLTLRTSVHDDLKNGVDNLIIDKKTGNLIGAFDEVADTNGPVFQEKQNRILDRNLNGGVSVKYGFAMSENGKIVPVEAQNNVPIFHLALSQTDLERGLAEVDFSGEKSSFERGLFKKFLDSIVSQILTMKGRYREFDQNLIVRLDLFARKLGEVYESILK